MCSFKDDGYMPEEIVKQHYIALVKLLKMYRAETLDITLLNVSHHFCKSLYIAAKAHPDLIFAQPQLYKSQLPFIDNLTFNAVVSTCLLAVRNKFDPFVTIQLMCGSLSIFALAKSSIEKHHQTEEEHQKRVKITSQINTEFSQLLETNQLHIWLSSYQLCAHVHLDRYPSAKLTSPSNALAYLANQLALLCTPHKYKKSMSFALAIKHLSLKCCNKWHRLLIPLLEYPSLTPVGSYVRLRDGSIQIVLSLSDKRLITKPLPTQQSVLKPSTKAGIQLIPAQQVLQLYPTQRLNSFDRLSQWWGKDLNEWLSNNKDSGQTIAFDSILPIKTAPLSLLIIQDQLNHINADIRVIAKAIEKEPSFAHQLQISASMSNRQKQPVRNIQQGLAMLGLERTNSILLQHSLLSRLNQQFFPLQEALLTFSQFFVFITGEFASRTKLVSPELARTTAYFLVSRLFTLPQIRSLNYWEAAALPAFKVASLVNVKENHSLKNGGFLLANAWHQNTQILEVLQHYDLVIPEQKIKPSTRQFCYLLGLSLILAQEHYFSGKIRCKETAAYFKDGLVELSFSQPEIINMMSDITSSSNVSCPLG